MREPHFALQEIHSYLSNADKGGADQTVKEKQAHFMYAIYVKTSSAKLRYEYCN